MWFRLLLESFRIATNIEKKNDRTQHDESNKTQKDSRLPGIRDAVYVRDVLIFDYLRVLRLDDYGRGYFRIWIAGDLQLEKRAILLLAQLGVDSLRSVHNKSSEKHKFKLVRIH